MPARLGRAWRSSGWRLAGLMLAALIAGVWLKAIAECLLAGVAIALAIGLYRLVRFARLLDAPRRIPAADGSGIWDALQNLVRRRQRNVAEEKRRLVRLLHEFRDAAAALPDAVIALDRGQRIEWFNKATRGLLGLKYPQDIGAHLTNLVRAPRFAEWLSEGAVEPLSDFASPADANLRLSLRLIRYDGDRAL